MKAADYRFVRDDDHTALLEIDLPERQLRFTVAEAVLLLEVLQEVEANSLKQEEDRAKPNA